jgi:hypothetical protein
LSVIAANSVSATLLKVVPSHSQVWKRHFADPILLKHPVTMNAL